MASKALFAALDFDLFTHIARGADLLPALATATGVAENRLVSFAHSIEVLGLVTEREGRFVNAPATASISWRERRATSGTTFASSTAPSATKVSDISARRFAASGYFPKGLL